MKKNLASIRMVEFRKPAGPVDAKGFLASAVSSDVRGKKGDEKLHYIVYTWMSHSEAYKRLGVTATAYLTGIPAAVGAEMLANGSIKRKGVYPPEVLDPESFLARIRQRDIPINEKVTMERSLA